MKKTIKLFSLIIGLSALMLACNSSDIDGFKKTKSGLHYKFDKENAGAAQPKVGDALIVEVEVKLDSTLVFSNIGNPSPLFLVTEPSYEGDINEGLLMLHIGDDATFAIHADSAYRFFPLPPTIEKGENSKLYFRIILHSIKNKAEIDKEQAAYKQSMEQAKNAEKDSLANYIAKKNIKVTPTATGLYIVSVKKGTGAKVEPGKMLKVNYVGRFLNGKLFDTSIEKEAKDAGIFNPNRPYSPMEYKHGEQPLIPGWDEAVSTMNGGDIVDVVIPSNMAYGERGSEPVIPPFTPLVFRIEVLSVE